MLIFHYTGRQNVFPVDQGGVGEDFRIAPYSVLSTDFVVPYSSV